MPTYQNTGTTPVQQRNIYINAGETKTIEEFFNPLPANITVVSRLGYNPIILSQAVNTTSTINVPAYWNNNLLTGSYCVTVFADTGECAVKYNDASATNQVIPQGTGVIEHCRNRTIDSIIVTVPASGRAYVTIKAE